MDADAQAPESLRKRGGSTRSCTRSGSEGKEGNDEDLIDEEDQ
jgi:hypothetical protein